MFDKTLKPLPRLRSSHLQKEYILGDTDSFYPVITHVGLLRMGFLWILVDM